jgi:hypothetical protein
MKVEKEVEVKDAKEGESPCNNKPKIKKGRQKEEKLQLRKLFPEELIIRED